MCIPLLHYPSLTNRAILGSGQRVRLSAIGFCRKILYQKELQGPARVWIKAISKGSFSISISAKINV